MTSFREGLRAPGMESRGTGRDHRRAMGRRQRRSTKSGLAAELVALKADVIVAQGITGHPSSKEGVTSTMPIVMVNTNRPCGPGFRRQSRSARWRISLGLLTFAEELSAKRLELLRETLPTLSRVALLFAILGIPAHRSGTENNAGGGTVPGESRLELVEATMRDDFPGAFTRILRSGATALIVLDGFAESQRTVSASWNSQHNESTANHVRPRRIHPCRRSD